MKEMLRHPQVRPVLIHTGQHYDAMMSEQFFADLEIAPPDFNLGVGSGTHAVQTAEVMRRLEPLLMAEQPDLVLVVGDVNSTLAAALTAVKLGIPVAHVEAGLRSFDRTMPEEINRLLTDAIADFLFVTEDSGWQNLMREGIEPGKIHFVGNVMIDAIHMFRPKWEHSSIFKRVAVDPERPYGVVTLHRPSNVDDPFILMNVLRALQELARHLPLIFPLHPRVGQQLRALGYPPSRREGITYVDPLGYLDFIALVSRAHMVLTDSGGLQEESTVLGVPCLTLRTTTERPVTITHGTNHVIGNDPARIVSEAHRVLNRFRQPIEPPPLWDGQASERIVSLLLKPTGKSSSPRV